MKSIAINFVNYINFQVQVEQKFTLKITYLPKLSLNTFKHTHAMIIYESLL